MEFLTFLFSSVWIFFGVLIFVSLLGNIVIGTIRVITGHCICEEVDDEKDL